MVTMKTPTELKPSSEEYSAAYKEYYREIKNTFVLKLSSIIEKYSDLSRNDSHVSSNEHEAAIAASIKRKNELIKYFHNSISQDDTDGIENYNVDLTHNNPLYDICKRAISEDVFLEDALESGVKEKECILVSCIDEWSDGINSQPLQREKVKNYGNSSIVTRSMLKKTVGTRAQTKYKKLKERKQTKTLKEPKSHKNFDYQEYENAGEFQATERKHKAIIELCDTKSGRGKPEFNKIIDTHVQKKYSRILNTLNMPMRKLEEENEALSESDSSNKSDFSGQGTEQIGDQERRKGRAKIEVGLHATKRCRGTPKKQICDSMLEKNNRMSDDGADETGMELPKLKKRGRLKKEICTTKQVTSKYKKNNNEDESSIKDPDGIKDVSKENKFAHPKQVKQPSISKASVDKKKLSNKNNGKNSLKSKMQSQDYSSEDGDLYIRIIPRPNNTSSNNSLVLMKDCSIFSGADSTNSNAIFHRPLDVSTRKRLEPPTPLSVCKYLTQETSKKVNSKLQRGKKRKHQCLDMQPIVEEITEDDDRPVKTTERPLYHSPKRKAVQTNFKPVSHVSVPETTHSTCHATHANMVTKSNNSEHMELLVTSTESVKHGTCNESGLSISLKPTTNNNLSETKRRSIELGCHDNTVSSKQGSSDLDLFGISQVHSLKQLKKKEDAKRDDISDKNKLLHSQKEKCKKLSHKEIPANITSLDIGSCTSNVKTLPSIQSELPLNNLPEFVRPRPKPSTKVNTSKSNCLKIKLNRQSKEGIWHAGKDSSLKSINKNESLKKVVSKSGCESGYFSDLSKLSIGSSKLKNTLNNFRNSKYHGLGYPSNEHQNKELNLLASHLNAHSHYNLKLNNCFPKRNNFLSDFRVPVPLPLKDSTEKRISKVQDLKNLVSKKRNEPNEAGALSALEVNYDQKLNSRNCDVLSERNFSRPLENLNRKQKETFRVECSSKSSDIGNRSERTSNSSAIDFSGNYERISVSQCTEATSLSVAKGSSFSGFRKLMQNLSKSVLESETEEKGTLTEDVSMYLEKSLFPEVMNSAANLSVFPPLLNVPSNTTFNKTGLNSGLMKRTLNGSLLPSKQLKSLLSK